MEIKHHLQQVKDIKLFTNIPISRETARKCLFTDNEENYKKYDFELSGYSAYDAQWIPHKGKFVYRLSLIDIISYLPIAEATIKDIKEIFTRPATIVKTLNGIGVNAAVKIAIKACS